MTAGLGTGQGMAHCCTMIQCTPFMAEAAHTRICGGLNPELWSVTLKTSLENSGFKLGRFFCALQLALMNVRLFCKVTVNLLWYDIS